MLYLVGRLAGPEEARRLAKVNLFDWRHEGQAPFARLTARPQTADAAVQSAQVWAADNYAEDDVVAGMADAAGLAARTFARRFRAATGYAPLEYVQRLRIEEAKQMLETTDAATEEIARAVGYDDPPSFRRLFKRLVGDTPAAYRRRCVMPASVRALPG